MRYLLLIAALLCVACRHAAPPTITVKDTTFVIAPPIIRDSGTAKTKIDTLIKYLDGDTLRLYDTLVSYVKLKDKDTVINWKYYPKNQTFDLMVKPDTLRFTYRDTVYKEARASPNNFMNELMLILAILAILALAIFIFLKK